MRYRVNLLGTWIDKITRDDVGSKVKGFVHSNRPHQVIPANVDFLRLSRERPAFRELINGAALVVPDGMPLVWGARLLGDPLPQRICGIEMILECAQVAVENNYSIFLLGAGPGVADAAASVLQARYPGLRIAGTYTPPPLPLAQDEEAETLRRIKEARPEMLFVAFGAPLQEEWIKDHMRDLDVPVCMGVGGAFDQLAGRVRRAPLWMQHQGLEWLYRLSQEPGRLWKRYLVQDLPIFLRLMMQRYVGTSPTRAILESLDDVLLVDQEAGRGAIDLRGVRETA